jgi:phenylacetic acid degradation operon negative regulatory protein
LDSQNLLDFSLHKFYYSYKYVIYGDASMKESELIFGLMAAFAKDEYTIGDLIHLASPFEVNDSSLRTILSRMAAKDIVKSRHEGKKVYYSFTDKGLRVKFNISSSFQTLDWDNWDQRWWGVLFTVPDIEKYTRHYIRKKLSAYRFASLYPGFWVRPLHPKEKIEYYLANIFSNSHCRVIEFNFLEQASPIDVAELWNLNQINLAFESCLQAINESFAAQPNLTPQQALIERMTVGEKIVKSLELDPLLPKQFLPSNWLGIELKRQFATWDRALTKLSLPYVNRIYADQ